jgi:ActR/RegA family two-component response regulator
VLVVAARWDNLLLVSRPTAEISDALRRFGAKHLRELRLRQVLDSHIQRVIRACDGNISLAAKLLGVHRRSLQRRLNTPRTKKRPAAAQATTKSTKSARKRA